MQISTRPAALWSWLMDIETGWLARHPAATLFIVVVCAACAPGAIECLI